MICLKTCKIRCSRRTRQPSPSFGRCVFPSLRTGSQIRENNNLVTTSSSERKLVETSISIDSSTGFYRSSGKHAASRRSTAGPCETRRLGCVMRGWATLLAGCAGLSTVHRPRPQIPVPPSAFHFRALRQNHCGKPFVERPRPTRPRPNAGCRSKCRFVSCLPQARGMAWFDATERRACS